MKLSGLWNYDDLMRSLLWVSIIGIAYYTIFGYSDYHLIVNHEQDNISYGVLWTWLNPYYWRVDTIYPKIVTGVQAIFVALQLLCVKKGWLSKNVVILNLFTSLLVRLLHGEQNVSVLAVAPFAAINPLFIIPVILQKLPLGWSWDLSDKHWACAFFGNGQGTDATLNDPCLSTAVKLNPYHAYSMTYIFLVFWVVIPLLLWWRKRREKPKFGNDPTKPSQHSPSSSTVITGRKKWKFLKTR